MKTRMYDQQKTPPPLAFAPVTNRLQSRPFAVQSEVEEFSPQQQETPDLQKQMEKEQRVGYNFANVSVVAPSTPPADQATWSWLQPRWERNQLGVVDVSQPDNPILQRMIADIQQPQPTSKGERGEPLVESIRQNFHVQETKVQPKCSQCEQEEQVQTKPSVQRAPGTVTQQDAPATHPTLHQGSTGTEVEKLQQKLNVQGAEPPLKVDGIFGPLTRSAAVHFQQTHQDITGKPLAADGIVGKLTWGALDQQSAQPDKKKDSGKSPKEELLEIFAKGASMTPEEATKAKNLLFQLKGDEFREVLKGAIASGAFKEMFWKLSFSDMLNTLGSLTQEVVVPTTLLKPATNTIKDDFKRANEIYKPRGIEIEQGNPVEISEATTKKLLGGDTDLDEFTSDQATAEELKLVEENRTKGRITGYWVPSMTSSRGEELDANNLKNLGKDRTSVVVNTRDRAQDTFAHELGHALGLAHEDSDPNNLMASGSNRNITGPGIDKLTDAQLAMIRSSVFMDLGKKGVGE